MDKICKICSVPKPLTEFYIVKKTGHPLSYCRPCNSKYATAWRKANPDRMEEIRDNWDVKNPDYNKEYVQRVEVRARRVERRIGYNRKHKLKKYNMIEAEYENLLIKQGSKCGICEIKIVPHDRNTHIDHCHDTGRIRGVLCAPCNLGLGYFRDDTNKLASAITYLECSRVVLRD